MRGIVLSGEVDRVVKFSLLVIAVVLLFAFGVQRGELPGPFAAATGGVPAG